MRVAGMAALAFCALASASEAALIGTELSLETFYQATSSSALQTIGFLTTATVKEPGVEFPNLKALQVNSSSSGMQLVNVAINAGNNFIEIDFSNSAPSTVFATGFRNGYEFTFDSSIAPSISSALIDRTVTTLGLSDDDVSFSGNKLAVNVEGLRFNRATFARINLTSQGGPLSLVPIPAAAWLFGSGLAAVWCLSKGKRATA